MKLSRTALKELKARYLDILKKCAYLNAIVLTGVAFSNPVKAAIDFTKYGDEAYLTGNSIYNLDTGKWGIVRADLDVSGGTVSLQTGPFVDSEGNTPKYGGFFAIEDRTISNMGEASFSGGRATEAGGAIYIGEGGRVDFYKVDFSDNKIVQTVDNQTVETPNDIYNAGYVSFSGDANITGGIVNNGEIVVGEGGSAGIVKFADDSQNSGTGTYLQQGGQTIAKSENFFATGTVIKNGVLSTHGKDIEYEVDVQGGELQHYSTATGNDLTTLSSDKIKLTDESATALFSTNIKDLNDAPVNANYYVADDVAGQGTVTFKNANLTFASQSYVGSYQVDATNKINLKDNISPLAFKTLVSDGATVDFNLTDDVLSAELGSAKLKIGDISLSNTSKVGQSHTVLNGDVQFLSDGLAENRYLTSINELARLELINNNQGLSIQTAGLGETNRYNGDVLFDISNATQQVNGLYTYTVASSEGTNGSLGMTGSGDKIIRGTENLTGVDRSDYILNANGFDLFNVDASSGKVSVQDLSIQNAGLVADITQSGTVELSNVAISNSTNTAGNVLVNAGETTLENVSIEATSGTVENTTTGSLNAKKASLQGVTNAGVLNTKNSSMGSVNNTNSFDSDTDTIASLTNTGSASLTNTTVSGSVENAGALTTEGGSLASLTNTGGTAGLSGTQVNGAIGVTGGTVTLSSAIVKDNTTVGTTGQLIAKENTSLQGVTNAGVLNTKNSSMGSVNNTNSFDSDTDTIASLTNTGSASLTNTIVRGSVENAGDLDIIGGSIAGLSNTGGTADLSGTQVNGAIGVTGSTVTLSRAIVKDNTTVGTTGQLIAKENTSLQGITNAGDLNTKNSSIGSVNNTNSFDSDTDTIASLTNTGSASLTNTIVRGSVENAGALTTEGGSLASLTNTGGTADLSGTQVNGAIGVTGGTVTLSGTTNVTGGVSGTSVAILNNSGDLKLSTVADNTGFVGAYNQTGGKTVADSDNFFQGTNTISGGILQTSGSNIGYSAQISGTGNLTHTQNTDDLQTLNSSIIGISGTGENKLTFNNGSYILGEMGEGESTDIVAFNNATLQLSSTAYSGETYQFNNSTVDLSGNGLNDIQFSTNNLSLLNTDLVFDIQLSKNTDGTLALGSDTITVLNQSGTVPSFDLDLSKVKVINKVLSDSGLTTSVSTQVLDGATFNPPTGEALVATDVYQYNVGLEGKQSIKLTALKATDGDSLTAVNQYNGNSAFYMTSLEPRYGMTSDLGLTGSGNKTIQGLVNASDIITSTIDANGHTMFDVQNENTNLIVKNVVLTGATSVLNTTKGSTTFENVMINGTSNIANVNGVAISRPIITNAAGTSTTPGLVLKNVIIQDLDDSIQNTGNMKVESSTLQGVTNAGVLNTKNSSMGSVNNTNSFDSDTDTIASLTNTGGTAGLTNTTVSVSLENAGTLTTEGGSLASLTNTGGTAGLIDTSILGALSVKGGVVSLTGKTNTLAVDGATTVAEGATLNAKKASLQGVTNAGVLNTKNSSMESVNNTNSFDSDTDTIASLTNTGSASLTNTTVSGSLENAGDLTAEGGSLASLTNTGSASLTNTIVSGSVENAGDLTAEGGSLASLTNTGGAAGLEDTEILGGLSVEGGVVSLTGKTNALAVGGATMVAGGATLNATKTSLQGVTNAGVLNTKNSSMGSVNNTNSFDSDTDTIASLTNTGGTADLTDTAILGGLSVEGGVVSLTGTTNALAVDGATMVAEGATLNATKASLQGVTNAGTLTAEGGSLASLTNTGSASLTNTTVSGSLENDGKINLAGSNELNGGVSGSGPINNSGDLKLSTSADNKGFAGEYNQTGGTTIANSNNFFQGTNTISGGTLQTSGESLGYVATVTGSGSITFESTSTDTSIVNDANNILLSDDTAGDSSVSFNKGLYTLSDLGAGSSTDTITFTDAVVQLTESENSEKVEYAGEKYVFNNSTINMQDGLYKTIDFENIAGTDTTLAVDIGLVSKTETPGENGYEGLIAKSDTLNVTDGSSFEVSNVNFKVVPTGVGMEDANKDNGMNTSYLVQVLDGNATFKDALKGSTSFNAVTNAYTYNAIIQDDLQSVKLDAFEITDGNSLTHINQYAGNSNFYMAVNGETGSTYKMDSKLGLTGIGNKLILGAVESDASASVIDANGYTMFDIKSENTNLTVKDLTIKKAASVLNNLNGTALLDNVIIKELANANKTVVINNASSTGEYGLTLDNVIINDENASTLNTGTMKATLSKLQDVENSGVLLANNSTIASLTNTGGTAGLTNTTVTDTITNSGNLSATGGEIKILSNEATGDATLSGVTGIESVTNKGVLTSNNSQMGSVNNTNSFDSDTDTIASLTNTGGTAGLTNTTVTDTITNSGKLSATGGEIKTLSNEATGEATLSGVTGIESVTNKGVLTSNNSQMGSVNNTNSFDSDTDTIASLTNTGSASLTASTVTDTITNSGKLSATGGEINKLVNTNLATLSNEVVDNVVNEKELTIASTQVHSLNNGENATATIKENSIVDKTINKGLISVDNSKFIDVENLKDMVASGNLEITNSLTGNGTLTMNGATLKVADGFKTANNVISNNMIFGEDIQSIKVGDLTVQKGTSLDIRNIDVSANNISLEDGTKLNVSLNNRNDYGSFSGTNLVAGEGSTIDFDLGDDFEMGLYNVVKTDTISSLPTALHNDEGYDFLDLADGRYSFISKESSEISKQYGSDKNQTAAIQALHAGRGTNELFNQMQTEMIEHLQSGNGALIKKAVKDLDNIGGDFSPAVQSHATSHFKGITSAVSEQSKLTSKVKGLSGGDEPQNVQAWVKALYNHSQYDGNGDFKANETGFVAGIQKQLTDDLTVGVGYAYGYADIAQSGRDTTADTNTAFAYAKYQPNEWFVEGVVSYSRSQYEESKKILSTRSSGTYNVDTFAVQALAGYDMAYNDFVITPKAGLRYMSINQESYTDSLDTHVDNNAYRYMTAMAGVDIRAPYKTVHGLYIRPTAGIMFGYDIISDNVSGINTLSNGATYTVSGDALDKFSTNINLGVDAELGDKTTFSVEYQGSYRKSYQEHGGMMKLKQNF